jgi:hypothetical protein
VGASDSTWTALVSGIPDGTEVAVSNTQDLRTGEKVRVVQAKQG